MRSTFFISQLASKSRLILLGMIFASSPALSQSATYKMLLEELYDQNFPIVKAEQITDLSNYQILDTREKEEFTVSHLPGATCVGYDSFDMGSTDGLDKGKPVLVYCTVGVRSQEVGKRLQDAGFAHVYNLYGGIIQWANLSKPLEVSGQPTDKVHTYSQTWGIWLDRGKKVY